MDSILSLMKVIATQTTPTRYRKLQTAIYLAQSQLNHQWYRFHLSQGKVLSDQLDQDLMHLAAGGFLYRACDMETRQPTITFSERTKSMTAFSDDINRFADCVSRLLPEDEKVLDAASTSIFFDFEKLGSPESKLSWYRDIQPTIRERATEICRFVNNN